MSSVIVATVHHANVHKWLPFDIDSYGAVYCTKSLSTLNSAFQKFVPEILRSVVHLVKINDLLFF